MHWGRLWRPARCNRVSIYFVEYRRAEVSASSARSNATAKEGYVNHNVSNVPVEARAAPDTGRGWYGSVLAARGRDIELFFFNIARAHCDGGSANPPCTVEGRRVTCGVL